MTLADEIRAEFQRIRARYEGCDIAAVRMTAVQKLEQGFDALEARLARCTCEPRDEFDVVAHLSQASRLNPLAAAAAVNLRKVQP